MLIKEIVNRRSIRNFKKDFVADDNILEIIKAAQFAPTSHHNRSVEFIVIKSQENKTKIYEIVGQQFIKKAPILIIPIINTQKSRWPVQDLSVASENIFLQATALKLGTVWKNINRESEKKVMKLLSIPKNYLLINLIPVGYPKTKRRPHSDKDFNQKKIHYEKY